MTHRYGRKNKFPSVADVARLVSSIKRDIQDDFRAYEDDDEPGILLTIGADGMGDWNYQTGDTQFTGGAYGHPYWGQAAIHHDTNPQTAAKEILDELREAAANDA